MNISLHSIISPLSSKIILSLYPLAINHHWRKYLRLSRFLSNEPKASALCPTLSFWSLIFAINFLIGSSSSTTHRSKLAFKVHGYGKRASIKKASDKKSGPIVTLPPKVPILDGSQCRFRRMQRSEWYWPKSFQNATRWIVWTVPCNFSCPIIQLLNTYRLVINHLSSFNWKPQCDKRPRFLRIDFISHPTTVVLKDFFHQL